MTANGDAPITQAEMMEMFGETIPMGAVSLLWTSAGTMTVGELRSRLRQIAKERTDKLRTVGDLFANLAPQLQALLDLELDPLPAYANGLWSRANVESMLADFRYCTEHVARADRPKS